MWPLFQKKIGKKICTVEDLNPDYSKHLEFIPLAKAAFIKNMAEI